MRNGWTGGQYSLFRALFGTYLFLYFAAGATRAAEFADVGSRASTSSFPRVLFDVFSHAQGTLFLPALFVLGAVLAASFALGLRDRAAAIALAYLCTCLAARPAETGPATSQVWIAVVLVLGAHALLDRAPYGSLDARGRVDPRGGWKMDPRVFAAVWFLLAAGYAWSARVKLALPAWREGSALAALLQSPFARAGIVRDLLLDLPGPLLEALTWGVLAAELFFAPLALFRATRPWIWTVALTLVLASTLVFDLGWAALGVVMLQLFAFDPAWVRPRRSSEPERVFYDGTCGLCHGFVRFVLAEDTGAAFRFAPLQGEAFATLVPERERANVPDSIVVRASDGRLLMKSAAVVHVLRALGGAWRVLAELLALVPRPLRDAGYDFVARVRHRLFARPEGACPLVPADLGRRFEF